MATPQRITFLVTMKEKTAITRHAREAGLSVGEFMRRLAANYQPPDARKRATVDSLQMAVDRLAERVARLEAVTCIEGELDEQR